MLKRIVSSLLSCSLLSIDLTSVIGLNTSSGSYWKSSVNSGLAGWRIFEDEFKLSETTKLLKCYMKFRVDLWPKLCQQVAHRIFISCWKSFLYRNTYLTQSHFTIGSLESHDGVFNTEYILKPRRHSFIQVAFWFYLNLFCIWLMPKGYHLYTIKI